MVLTTRPGCSYVYIHVHVYTWLKIALVYYLKCQFRENPELCMRNLSVLICTCSWRNFWVKSVLFRVLYYEEDEKERTPIIKSLFLFFMNFRYPVVGVVIYTINAYSITQFSVLKSNVSYFRRISHYGFTSHLYEAVCTFIQLIWN